MKTRIILTGILFAVFCTVSFSYADVPQMINYQGKLTTPPGGLIDTTVAITFSIYGDSTSANPLWSEQHPAVEVDKSIFNVLLGSINPLPDTIFRSEVRYLAIKVGTDPEMIPRRPLLSVAYALRSEFSEYTDTAEYARVAPAMPDADWMVTGSNVYRLAGNVGIGTGTPAYTLDIQKAKLASDTIAHRVKVKGYASDQNPAAYLQLGKSGCWYLGQDWMTFPGDTLGVIDGFGINGRRTEGLAARMVFLQVGEGPADTVVPGAILFSTCDGDSISERMRIGSSGNVGIGTPTPTERLEVNGDIRVGNIRLTATDIDDDQSIRMIIDRDNNETNQTFSVWKDGGSGTELFTIQEDGKVGIGTTPGQRLDVNGDIKAGVFHGDIYQDLGSSQALRLKANGYISLIADANNDDVLHDGIFMLYNNAETEADIKMIVTEAGYVGIGVPDPECPLEVSGDIHASGTISGNFSGTIDNADQVDGMHASATPTANYLYPLDANAKFPIEQLYTGPGSGLDADLLDNQTSAFYLNASNLSSGTISEERLPQDAIDDSEIEDGSIGNADISTSADISPDKISGTAWTSANDGPGTNLDADLLDNQEGTYYSNASNLNAGTISEERLPQNAIDDTEIQDGSITYSDLADLHLGSDVWNWTIGVDGQVHIDKTDCNPQGI